MKLAKWIICLVLFIVCFIGTDEMYQRYITSLADSCYYIYKDLTGNSMQFLNEASAAGSENDVAVFCMRRMADTSGNTLIKIYTNDDGISQLAEKHIYEGNYESFMTGKSSVSIEDFGKIPNVDTTGGGTIIYLLGDKDNVKIVKAELEKGYDISRLYTPGGINLVTIIIIIWGIAFCLLILLTWYDIQFNKKKNLVCIVLGASSVRLAVRSIIEDAVAFGMIFAALYFVGRSFTEVTFGQNYVIAMFASFMLINSLLYVFTARPDYKKVLLNAAINNKLMSGCFVIKTVVSIAIIILLSLNLEMLGDSYYNLSFKNTTGVLSSFSFTGIIANSDDSLESSKKNQGYNTGRLFLDMYAEDRVALATSMGSWEDDDGNIHPITAYNGICKDFIDVPEITDFINNEQYDVYIFYKEGIDAVVDPVFGTFDDYLMLNLTNLIYDTFGLSESEYTCTIQKYNSQGSAMYFDFSDASIYDKGFLIEKNPVVVVLNIRGSNINKNIINEVKYSINYLDPMYEFSGMELDDVRQKYDLQSIDTTSVADYCANYFNLYMRKLTLDCILSGLILVVELMMTILVIKLEYMIYAKELAIKKILGYSIFKKNSLTISSSVFITLSGIIICVMMGALFKIYSAGYPFLIGLLLLVVEIIVMAGNIKTIERRSVPRILKGELVC